MRLGDRIRKLLRLPPAVGTIGGWGMLFILRKKRVVVADASEHIHASAAGAMGRNADPVNFDEGA
ncbi:hypothetical protein HGD85_00935 [Rhodobacteraceae bacterium R_SAG10]|nr:hypothetical protein [Rhodobacteraceae bacterium R_SAG10]